MNPSRKWLTRLIVTINLLIGCAMITSGEVSDLYYAITSAGVIGQVAVALLVFVGMIALVDVIVNDIMPKRFVIGFALRYRHTVYMLISLGCLSFIFVIVKLYGPSVVLLHYGSVAAAALIIAVLDIRERWKEHADDGR